MAEAPTVASSSPPSKSVAEAKSLLGGAVEQPLAVMPITVWNPPSDSVKSPPRRVERLKRRNPESRVGDFLMLNSRQAQSHPSLRILILGGRKRCLLMKLWPYPLRGSPR